MCANSHSSMVQFFGTNYEPEINYYYVVMEHVETGSLEDYLKVRRRRRGENLSLAAFRVVYADSFSNTSS